ncbi:protocadherin alpha-11-like isoform X1, partial [Argonauta hians]
MAATAAAMTRLVGWFSFGGGGAGFGVGFAAGADPSELTYRIREELPSGTLVGDILTDSKVLDAVDPGSRSLIRLSLLSQAGEGAPPLFDVTEESGELHTAQRLDAESLCDVGLTCVRTLDVAVQKSKELLKVLKVNVIIEDWNDHAPEFSEDRVEIQFLDGDTNKRKSIPKATDKDVSSNNSRIIYTLKNAEENSGGDGGGSSSSSSTSSSSSPFKLDVNTRPDGSSNLYLHLTGKLDRETKPEYKLKILAKDTRDPSKVGQLNVDVIVTDVNDNPPVFEKDKYNVTTENEVHKDKPIVTVKAHDKDFGENGEVIYKFSPSTSSGAQALFKIDEKSGDIFLRKKISVEQPTEYKLFVEAVDGAKRPLSGQVVVYVRIIHSQNNPPKINVNFVSHKKNTAGITEGAESESFVAYVRVKDPDVGENGKVGCTLTHDYFRLRNISEAEYKVVIRKPVDREKNDHFNVTITCHDQGAPPLYSENSFRVEVDDVNDEVPTFDRNVYDVTFEENSIIGIKVEQVTASDADVGSNGDVRYFLGRDALPYFVVDANTGVIRTVTVFDRESYTKNEFKIYAKDLGVPSQTSSATLRVNVLDVNDEAPVFTEDLFHFKTYENQLPKFPVGYINATDRDLGDGGKLSYSLINNDNQVLPFWISDDGFLSVGQLLDHEYLNEYRFKVFVKDQGNPSLNNSVNVLVEVLDENDNKPYFLFPSVNNFSMAVYYYPDGEKEITVLQATDRDSGDNARLVYEILSGNENGLFAVDPVYGALSFARDAFRDDNGQYMLQLSVRDQGNPSLSTSANFSLSLVVSNETSSGSKAGEFLSPTGGGVGENLLIVIALIAVTGSVGLVILITICVIRWNDKRTHHHHHNHNQQRHHRRNRGAANNNGAAATTNNNTSRLTSSSSSASSGGGGFSSSKCLPSPQISTSLDLGPSLHHNNDNSLKGNSTFRTSQRSRDHNIYNTGYHHHNKQAEMYAPSSPAPPPTVNDDQFHHMELYPIRNTAYIDPDRERMVLTNNQHNYNQHQQHHHQQQQQQHSPPLPPPPSHISPPST